MKTKEEMLNEFKLRRLINKAIRIKRAKEISRKEKEDLQESQLRDLVKHYILEATDLNADAKPVPPTETYMTVVAGTLELILTNLKTSLRALSRPEERKSFRLHTVKRAKDVLDFVHSLEHDGGEAIGESDVFAAEEDMINKRREEERVTVNIDDDPDFIPLEGDIEEPEKMSKEQDKEDRFKAFAISTENQTGARFAMDAVDEKSTKASIINNRAKLADPEDKAKYEEYLLYNIDMHLVKEEEKISSEIGQTPAFNKTIVDPPSGAVVASGAKKFAGDETGIGIDKLPPL